ncbi:UvrD-helicase domain-containing protein [Pedobacter gandavensis]|uniref:UvrD-helicase domain-containing protein n=1 Tax=Pedobacter gandavensis TaxID=2679963 RepID=UPI00292E48AC|nr:UvrD-helicase domain-containing protein [Pedobacter gandavensis]
MSKKTYKQNLPKKESDAIPLLLKILLIILTAGTWYLYQRWQEELQKKDNIQDLLPQIATAQRTIDQKQTKDRYFSGYDEREIRETQAKILNSVPKKYKSYKLERSEIELISRFVATHKNLATIRSSYNEIFIQAESKKYKDYFSNLDQYPLSNDQMRAVICDEDNNLVIAGAGTGKTTTISAKIAYILEKGLARPEELLVISFTKAAVIEMYGRTCVFLKNKEQAEHITFKTFNSFGNMVNRYCNPLPTKIGFDGKDYLAKEFLQKQFDKLFLIDPDFQNRAINFIAFFARPKRNEAEFKTRDEYLKHEKSFRNISLNNIHLKSKEEVMIANFLYVHQVEFKYESFFPLEREDHNPDFQSYAPDFYLPQYNIYHEHFGIDENGEVPEWFQFRPPFHSAKEQYHHGIHWKDTIHQKYGTKLIKTYSFQSRNNSLLRSLKEQLISLGVELNKRPAGEILKNIKESEDFEGFMGLIYTFMNLMKSNNSSVNKLTAEKTDQRLKVFLEVLGPLHQAYEQELSSTASIDYNDMVNNAANFIQNGDYQKKYKYILVDEFQDMSVGRYGLIKALKNANPAAKLYAVGDDWQSIFRFTGSDISMITSFAEHFGVTAYNSVLQTYRFNDQILEVSSGFIQSNPNQLQKQLTSPYKATLPPFQLLPVPSARSHEELKLRKWDILVESLTMISRTHAKAEVFLIGRYHHNKPPGILQLQKNFTEVKISYYTAHACKGLTCDVAIILDLDAGVFGFPSEVADDPILNHLLQEGDDFENAEERRLFYVAITRARHQVYFMYNPKNQSKFLEELIEVYDIGVIPGTSVPVKYVMS